MKRYSKGLKSRMLVAASIVLNVEARGPFGALSPPIRCYPKLCRRTAAAKLKPMSAPPARNGATLEAAPPAQARGTSDTNPGRAARAL